VLRIIRSNFIAIIILVALVAAYFVLRTSPSDVASMEELGTILDSGKPVLVEFYSNI